ncbi:CotH kinase family protein [Lachnospiraceae bacterium ZAX-1]
MEFKNKFNNKLKDKFKFEFILASVVLFIALLTVCVLWLSMLPATATRDTQANIQETTDLPKEAVVKKSKDSYLPELVKDDDAVYLRDGYGDDLSMVYLYMTIQKGNASENSDKDWSELAKHSAMEYQELGVEYDRVECILQEGDENGPIEGMFGYGLAIPNGVVQITGNASSEAPLKSYKISLKEGANLWRGQDVVNLNKHAYDYTGLRNKLAYDLIKEIPDMISFRTQFVHLYVKDETKNRSQERYQDYGLFTQIEQPDKTYLRNHGLDQNGHFYKPVMFEYDTYEDAIKLKNDPAYSEKQFERVIECNGNEDHSKLINMLKDLNDTSLNFKEVFEKYFDKDNFFTWLSFQILIGNTDTISQNYMLYSPRNSEKWYYISGDANGALTRKENYVLNDTDELVNEVPAEFKVLGWEYGITNYWGNPLMRKILKEKEDRDLLLEKLDQMMAYLPRDKINERIKEYLDVTVPFKKRLPDSELISYKTPVDSRIWHSLYDGLAEEVELNYQLCKQSLDSLMPFYMGIPTKTETGYRFSWDYAYSFLEDAIIQYKFELSKDYKFNSIIHIDEELYDANIELDDLDLAPGLYFYRVMAYDNSAHTQYAFDYIVNESFSKQYAILAFNVDENGEVARVADQITE